MTSEPEKPLREQLLEARDKLRRQIEICEHPARMPTPPYLIAELEAELSQIEEALANLGSTDAELVGSCRGDVEAFLSPPTLDPARKQTNWTSAEG
jgi:hypothetical protein